MKPSLLFAFLLLFTGRLMAQNIDVNRTSGLVTVNGTELCYIVPADKGSTRQFYVKNLQQKDLLFVSENEGKQWDRESQAFVGDDFRVVFLGTHNWCTTNGSGIGFNNYQKIAKILVKERLIQGNEIYPEAERLFVKKNRGIFATKIAPGTPPPAVGQQPASNPPVEVIGEKPQPRAKAEALEGDQYLVNGRHAGSFSTGSKNGRETVSLYDALNVKVATATRTDEDWELTTLSDNKKVELRYDAKQPILGLFSYLLQKKYITVKP